MRLKTLCLSLLLLVGINLGTQLFVLTPQKAYADLGAFPTEKLVQEQRKFHYESLNISGKATLTIYTLLCNDAPDDCATKERGISERWVHDPDRGGSDNVAVFTPTNNAGTQEDVHSPDIVVNTNNLSTGSIAADAGEYVSFPIYDGSVAKSLIGGTVGELGADGESDGSAIPGTAPEADEESREEDSCESRGRLGWIMCPGIELLDGLFNWLDTQIQDLLFVDEDKYRDADLKTAWARIRNIAYSILVPIILVMIISTALGFEFISAYTVKKALPRFVAAIMFIALSWEITGFLIEMFNNIGRGVLGLMAQPFGLGGPMNLGTLFSPDPVGGAIQYSLIALGIGALFWVQGLAGLLLLYLIGAVLIFMAAFFVLVIRQMFIIALILVAPLAILAWIFPGNDKLWKFWWGAFTKLLLMFPLIMGLIAIGRIFAWLLGGNGAAGLEGGILNPLLKMTAYIAPYIFIPATFKFAGGVFANLAGMVNDRGRGPLDRLKKSRGERWGQIGRNAKTSELFKGSPTSRLNKAVQYATTPTALLPGRFGVKGRSTLSTAMSGEMGEAVKMLQAQGLLDDEAGNEFIKYGHSFPMFQKRIAELRSQGRGDLADKLSAYGQHVGKRSAILGAMKINASFGKLSDGALKQLDHVYGDSQADKAAKQSAFGDLIFTSKGAGNWVTYGSRIVDNKVVTYSDNADFVMGNVTKSMLDAGPNEVSRIKPYKNTDDEGNVIWDTKELTAQAIARGVTATTDEAGRRRAIENLAQSAAAGAYNDPRMKAELEKAISELDRIPGGVTLEVDGVPQGMSYRDYYEQISKRVQRGRDPREDGFGDEGGPAGPLFGGDE